MAEVAVAHAVVSVTADPQVDASILRIRGVGKVFGRGAESTVALHDVNLDVAQGEFFTIVGTSGCGKSTLLNLIAGLDEPTTGTIEVDAKVAFMFQDATLLPWLTARQNVEIALKLRGVPAKERRDRAGELLETVRLDGRGDARPHELSGGMRQRVALARCLAQDAHIVLMDEPLGALDAMTRDHLHDEIDGLARSQGLTVVFVTHNVREAIRLGDRVILMGSAPGRILHEETIPLAHPRVMDSSDVSTRASALTARLKAQGHAHVD